MKKLLFSLLLMAGVAARGQEQPAQITLQIGSPVPELKIDKWLKGEPVNIEKGKVYVFEFWATWCGPCRLGMPHMSSLAQKYKKATFVGVDASESQDDPQKAQAFVDVSKDMMAYHIAYAVPKGEMTKNWLQAAGRNGIPVAFVIDKQGRIGWIGHPMMGLEEAVDAALNNKLTPALAAEITKTWENNDKVLGEKYDRELKAALNEGRVNDALSLNDSLVKYRPYMVAIAATKKYALLTAINPKAARSYGEELIKTQGNAPEVLKGVGYTIFDGSDARVRGEIKVKISGSPDWDLARKLLVQSTTCSETDRFTKAYLDKLDSQK